MLTLGHVRGRVDIARLLLAGAALKQTEHCGIHATRNVGSGVQRVRTHP